MSTSISKKTILLVEDEALIAMNEAAMLKKYGYQVITAYNAREAIETAREKAIDLVLMDIDLGYGKMDGTEAAEIILKEKDIPIVFLSSHTEPDVVEKTEGITSYGYIVKNSGETVILASIKMAFRLYDAHMELKTQKQRLNTALVKYEQTAEELAEKSDELERYFTSSLDMLCIADTKGEFLRLNPEWEKLLGYAVTELEGRSFMDFVHPDDKEETLQAISKLEQQEEVFNFENRYLCKDGSYRWIEWRSTSIGTRIYAAARDMTERKRINSELQSKTEYLEIITQNMLDLLALTDIEGNFEFVGKSHEILGYNPADLLGTNVMALVHPEDYQRIKEELRKVEYRCRCADGTYLWVETHGKILNDESGNPRKIIFNTRNITERKQAEKQLKNNEVKFRSVFSSSPDAMVLANRETGIIIEANQAAAELFEISLNELIGMHQKDLHPREEQALAEKVFKYKFDKAEQKAPPVEIEIQNRKNMKKIA